MGIEVFENFLEENVYNETLNASYQVLKSGGNQFSTNRHWDYGIVKDSAPVLVHNIIQTSVLYKTLKTEIESKTKMRLYKGSLMIYFWTRYSYIPWHNDQDYDGAMTIYLNEKWHPDNGGYFLYTEDKKNVHTVYKQKEDMKPKQVEYEFIDNIHAIIPRKNLAILQTDKIHHCTTPVNFFGDLRVTVQAFLENDNSQEETDK